MKICDAYPVVLREIESYIEHFNGLPLIVGIDNTEDYKEVLSYLLTDSDKKTVRVSDSCFSELPPNPNMLLGNVIAEASTGNIVWLGAIQSVMLHDQASTEEFIITLAATSVPSPVIVISPYICGLLQTIAGSYIKLGYWFVTYPSVKKDVPSICLYRDAKLCPDSKPITGMKSLLRNLEDGEAPERISFVSSCRTEWISASMFPLSKSATPYETICANEPGIRAFTKQSDGTNEQWTQLAGLLRGTSFAMLCTQLFGNLNQLNNNFADFIREEDTAFLCYIALKVFATKDNSYLSECLKRATKPEDVYARLYDAILTIAPSDSHFKLWMLERRRLLANFDEDSAIAQEYCDHATLYGRDVLAYLSADSEEERAAIIHAICSYNYSVTELCDYLKDSAPQLALYLRHFTFDAFNTKVMESDDYIRALLTDYFDRYKLQKLSNVLEDDFISIVEEEAVKRSFMKLQARSNVVKKMDKSDAAPFFFDALGVEFLAYIEAKCEEYGMQFDCQIARCDLPSITSCNKEFYNAFPPDTIRKVSKLDELKHQGTTYDYRSTKEPIHIFDELAVIDENLKKYASWLRKGTYQKVIILSDHGASRLAVVYESENDKLELTEKGQHSGRCCPCASDPKIPFASYDEKSGFVILANYERFKGSRKADVEAHGGATLEETVVPVITLTAKPKEQQIFFPEDTVTCSAKTGSEIKLFANPPIHEPRMVVKETSYDGIFDGDKHNVLFKMPDIRRKGHFVADIYDANTKIATLTFDTIRSTRIVDDF